MYIYKCYITLIIIVCIYFGRTQCPWCEITTIDCIKCPFNNVLIFQVFLKQYSIKNIVISSQIGKL